MRPRRTRHYRPGLESLEPKQTPGGGAGTSAVGARAAAPRPNVTGVSMDRITNPTPVNAILKPPFPHVLVQDRLPVKGRMYNILYITVYNRTGRTFTADDGLTVRLTNQGPAHAYPILSGEEEWKPRERIVFYALTKKYYPLSPVTSAGFLFNFVKPQVMAIPGPSGIFQRIRYNPATFDRMLDRIVVSGPGSRGHELGLPDTSLWEIIPASLKVVPL